jgi:ABC-2 type transport system permease protein
MATRSTTSVGASATTAARRTWQVLAKDLRLGPRSPLLLWALVLPVVMTLLFDGVFGNLLERPPRLGIVDAGGSEIATALEVTDGIEVVAIDDADTLRRLLEDHDLDAGLVLPEGFDAAVRAGERPLLQLYAAGESLASDRLVVALTTTDLVRQVAGRPPPVEVEVVALGEVPLDLALRALPLLVIFAVAVGGAMVPAMSLVEEKERRTLDAVLVTPVTITDVLVAKGLLGVILATLAGTITLALNDAFGSDPLALVAAVVIGAVMMAEFGLMLGAWARDTNTLFTAWKSGAILLIFPVIFYLFPDLPQWIARLGPTYYVVEPVFAVAIEGAGLSEVAGQLGVAIMICAALAPAVVVTGRWMERRLSATSRPGA